MHGQTYQALPVACAAALEVQRIIQEDGLLENVVQMGMLLSDMLARHVAVHPNVGDVRGAGLFWGIEFVQDKTSKRPFPKEQSISSRISQSALTEFAITIYDGSGTVDGNVGDHIILAPPYTITKSEVVFLARTTQRLIEDFFSGFV